MAAIAQSLQATGDGVVHFLRWWREELAGLVPQRVRARSAAKIIICSGQDGYRVLETVGGKLRPARAGADLSALDAVTVASQLAKANPAEQIGIRVPFDSWFVRQVELPRNAHADGARNLQLALGGPPTFKRQGR